MQQYNLFQQSNLMFKPKPNSKQTNEEKWETSSTSTNESVAPPFINEQTSQWPTWSKPVVQPVAQKTQVFVKTTGKKVHQWGFVQEPKFEGVVYQHVDHVPQGNYIGRGPTRYYKYYVDSANDAVYFYPFQGMLNTNSVKLDHKLQQNELLKDYRFLKESIKIVPMAIFQSSEISKVNFSLVQ